MQFQPAIGTDSDGHLVFCPICYPMLALSGEQLHLGHIRREFLAGRDDAVYEGDTPLPLVEEAVVLPGVPGALLREYVTLDGTEHQLIFCERGHRGVGHGLLRRLRYSPTARLVSLDVATAVPA
jgi:hypothetical protein